MNALDVVSHIVHAAKDSVATFPVAKYSWVVLRLVSRKILFARKSSPSGLGAVCVATEEGLGMAFVMLPQVATPGKHCS